MSESIKKNSIMVLIRNMAFMVFPLITFPYLSRILGPEGMGKINFASSFSNYFAMVASLGIPMYGAREIARVRDNKEEVNKAFNEIFTALEQKTLDGQENPNTLIYDAGFYLSFSERLTLYGLKKLGMTLLLLSNIISSQ